MHDRGDGGEPALDAGLRWCGCVRVTTTPPLSSPAGLSPSRSAAGDIVPRERSRCQAASAWACWTASRASMHGTGSTDRCTGRATPRAGPDPARPLAFATSLSSVAASTAMAASRAAPASARSEPPRTSCASPGHVGDDLRPQRIRSTAAAAAQARDGRPGLVHRFEVLAHGEGGGFQQRTQHMAAPVRGRQPER